MSDITKLKKGSKVYIVKSYNGASHLEGKVVEIVASHGSGNYTVKDPDSLINYSIYSTGKADEFVIPTKEYFIKFYKDKLDSLEKEVNSVRAEIAFHEKYDSMEEFVADKIGMLMQADTKEARVEILKTLKQTNFI